MLLQVNMYTAVDDIIATILYAINEHYIGCEDQKAINKYPHDVFASDFHDLCQLVSNL